MLISTAISEIRRGLGRPHEAVLSDPDIILELWQALTYYRSLLNLTQETWSIKRKRFTVQPGTPTESNLGVSDFGSCIFITSKDDTNPYFIQRTINVVKPELLSMYFSGPVNLQFGGSWAYGPHVARVFSIFKEGSSWKIKWLPAHATVAEYEMWYVPNCATQPPLFDDQMGFPVEESSFLIVNDCIINLFPHIADEELGLNPKQQALFDIAKKKVEQLTPVLEARRWDGAVREPMQHRRIYGSRRSNFGGNNY